MSYALVIQGLDQMRRNIKKLGKEYSSFKRIWDEMEVEFWKSEDEFFNTRGGGEWKPLNTKYAEWKNKNYPGRQIMVLHGNLKASLTKKTKDTVSRKSNKQAEFGTKIKYAKPNDNKRNLIDISLPAVAKRLEVFRRALSNLYHKKIWGSR